MKLKETTKLLKHQDDDSNFGNKVRYLLNASDMGTGKSLSSIASIVKDHKHYDQTLIICPAFLKDNWANEFDKFVEGAIVTVVNSPKDIQTALLSDVIIVNYARIEISAPLFQAATRIIFDEAHYLKNIEAKRTFLTHKFVQIYRPSMLILLTGTPVKNRVPEFYSLLKLLSLAPEKTNGKNINDKYKTELQFSRHFSNESIIQFKVFNARYKKKVLVKKSVFEGIKNEDELKTYFAGKYVRRLTKDVITLPEMKEIIVRVNYKSKDTKLAEEFAKFKIGSDPKGALATLKKDSAIAKAKFTSDYAKNLFEGQDEQVVIFSDHIDSTKQIAERLKVPFIIGSTPMDKRTKIIKRFTDGDIPYLVATIGAASTGLNLVNACQLVFNDMSYIPSDNAQAKKRIHRIGQERECLITIIAGSFIDERIIKSLQAKQEAIDKLIDK